MMDAREQPGNHLDDELLSEIIDGDMRANDDSANIGHLAECRNCQQRLTELNAVRDMLANLPEIDVPHDFRLGPRLVGTTQAPQMLRRLYLVSRVASSAIAAGFVAAVILLAVDGGMSTNVEPGIGTAGATVQRTGASGARVPVAGSVAAGAAQVPTPISGSVAAARGGAPAAAAQVSPAALSDGSTLNSSGPIAGSTGSARAAPAAASSNATTGGATAEAASPSVAMDGSQQAAPHDTQPLPAVLSAQSQVVQAVRVAALILGFLTVVGLISAIVLRRRLRASSFQLTEE